MWYNEIKKSEVIYMDTMDNKQIGLRIAQARNDKNITGKELAIRVGVAASTISRYEKGEISKIKIPVIEAIARSLDVNPMWLIGKSPYKDTRDMLSANNRSSTAVNSFTDDEIHVILMYRRLPQQKKAAIKSYLEFLIKKDDGCQSVALVAENPKDYNKK
nr:MAG TPA: helix-turn-helix domain protein [Caudoviricetes sp.]